MTENEIKIGLIGQGWIGKNYADNFEERGFSVVRYALEPPYNENKEKIKGCDIVFIAVPTPTTPKGFDDSIVRSVISLVGEGKVAVIKSTLVPGTAKSIQKENPKIIVLDSPEFLSEATAAHDVAYPFSSIVGMPVDDEAHKKAAQKVVEVMPKAPFSLICSSDESEIIKYAHNISGYAQIITFNLLYEVANSLGHDWNNVKEAIEADPFIPNRYANPVHKSGRGAGGHCFVKDMAAFSDLYEKLVKDPEGINVLKSLEEKNKKLLIDSNKDIEILRSVYGEDVNE